MISPKVMCVLLGAFLILGCGSIQATQDVKAVQIPGSDAGDIVIQDNRQDRGKDLYPKNWTWNTQAFRHADPETNIEIGMTLQEVQDRWGAPYHEVKALALDVEANDSKWQTDSLELVLYYQDRVNNISSCPKCRYVMYRLHFIGESLREIYHTYSRSPLIW